MKTEEIKKASDELKRQITELIKMFIDANGPCEVNIRTYADTINTAFGKSITQHNVEVEIKI